MNTERIRIGIKRQVDNLGRIVLPKEYRELYRIDPKDEVFVIGTSEGMLITNHKYKVVQEENKESAPK